VTLNGVTPELTPKVQCKLGCYSELTVTLIADIDGAKFISHSNLEMTQYLQKLLNKQRFKLTPGFYTRVLHQM